ncbi:hypothetical protein MNBD_ACTINO01-1516, partial [hydrothermal vent metagenome]
LYLTTIGSLLRKRRDAARLTLAEVSERSGVTIAHLSRIENGLTDPRLSTLQRVMDAIGVNLSDLAVARTATVPVDTVLERRASGRSRLDRAGLGTSDPSARLDRKEQAGVDVSLERSMVASS